MDSLETKIHDYTMTDEVAALVRETRLLLIAGIVGGGKDTVVSELLRGEGFHRIVSHTTRPIRMNHGRMEQDGIDYHFVSLDQASELVDQRAFVEVKYVHGNVYGTSAAELQAAHDERLVAVTDIDIQGVIEYLDVKPDTHAIFLLPPSVDTWLQRLTYRYGDLAEHEEEITTRFRTAREEIQNVLRDDRFVIVINDDLATTVERIQGVLQGEVDESSQYASVVTEHLLAFLDSRLGTH